MTRLPRSRDEAGFTVVEMMVVLLLVSLVSVVLFGFLDGTTEASTRASLNVQAEKDAQLVLRTVSQNIRGAQVISTTYPGGSTCPAGSYSSPFTGYRSCLSFTVVRSVTGGQQCPYTTLVYGLSGGVLREDRTEYDCANVPTSSTIGKVLMTDVVNDAATPLFNFYDRTGNDVLSMSPARTPTSASTVRVTLVKQYRRLNTAPLRLTTSISLRNKR